MKKKIRKAGKGVMIFKASKSARFSNANAQRYGEYLYGLSEEEGGKLYPALIVEKAKEKKSPVHDYFEWDDTVAGPLYRITQARELVRSIIVEYKSNGHTGEARAFMNVHNEKIYDDNDDEREPSRNYVFIEKVAGNKVFLDQIVNAAHAEMVNWSRKYKQYQRWKEFENFTTIFEAIDKLPCPV